MNNDPAAIARSLSEAQKRAIMSATWCGRKSPWWPEGWYTSADKRVRYNLCRKDLLTDYLQRSNRLTLLGLAVRAELEKQ